VGLGFEIRINGEATVIAGRPELDVLTTMVTFVRSHNDIELRAGGMQRLNDGGSEQVEWLLRKLGVGDEIRIRIVDGEPFSEPISVERDAGGSRDQHEREYYERLKRKYERQ
jgi:hypothetical protein